MNSCNKSWCAVIQRKKAVKKGSAGILQKVTALLPTKSMNRYLSEWLTYCEYIRQIGTDPATPSSLLQYIWDMWEAGYTTGPTWLTVLTCMAISLASGSDTDMWKPAISILRRLDKKHRGFKRDAVTLEQLETLLQKEPFYCNGKRKSRTLQLWQQWCTICFFFLLRHSEATWLSPKDIVFTTNHSEPQSWGRT